MQQPQVTSNGVNHMPGMPRPTPVDSGGNGPQEEPVALRTMDEAIPALEAAKQGLYTAISRLTPANATAVAETLTNARKELQNFSQNSLILDMQKQAKRLEAAINTQISTEKDNNTKAELIRALQTLAVKYQELAKARIYEIRENEPQHKEAKEFLLARKFSSSEGESLTKINDKDKKEFVDLDGFGTKYTQISGVNPNTGRAIKVYNEDGAYSSRSPEDLAYVVKLNGCTKFTFTSATSGRHLMKCMKEMLRVGIKDVSVDPGVSSLLYGNRYIHGTMWLPTDHLKLEQLERICAASATAAYFVEKNDVFKGDDAKLYRGEKTLREHEIATFLRLTSEGDRLVYLQILYPDKANAARKYAEFTSKLEKAGITIPCGTEKGIGGDLLRKPDGSVQMNADGELMYDPETVREEQQTKHWEPRDYFRKKLLNRGFMVKYGVPTPHRVRMKSQYERELNKVDLANFNSDDFDFNKRKSAYFKATDAELLSSYAKSDKLSIDEVKKLATAVFDHSQEDGSDPVKLNTNPVTKTRSISSADETAFINKALPLLERLGAWNEQSALLDALRQKAAVLYKDGIKHPGKTPADAEKRKNATKHFQKNKRLLDLLEAKAITNPNELNTHLDNNIENFSNIESLDDKAGYFIAGLSSAAQQKLCGLRDPENVNEHTLDMEQRSLILLTMILNCAKERSATAIYYLNKDIAPLIENLSTAEMSELTQQLAHHCQQQGIQGVNLLENEALHIIRKAIKEQGDYAATTQPLKSVNLFATYYAAETEKEPAEKLLKRIECYADAMPDPLVHYFKLKKLQTKFAKEMDTLLPQDGYGGPNDDLTAILDHLDSSKSSSEAKELIKIIHDLRPRAPVNEHDDLLGNAEDNLMAPLMAY